MATDRRNKFVTMPGEIESIGLSIPKRLKHIVADAPEGDVNISTYLSNLVEMGTITADDAMFLIDSEALQS